MPLKEIDQSIYGVSFSTHHWLERLMKKSFAFLFYKLSLSTKATQLSLTTVLSGVSTLDQIQLP